tara:strand:- start:83 stop:478 length:396 start_codon:yes stop_codon:yes gene_type:complete
MTFSITNKAYLLSARKVNKLESVCKMKVMKLKSLKCQADCKEVHLDLILQKLGDVKKSGLFMVEYSFNDRKFKVQKPDPRLSSLKSKKSGEFAFDIKVPKALCKKNTLKLDICITYDESAWKIKHLDAHQM